MAKRIMDPRTQKAGTAVVVADRELTELMGSEYVSETALVIPDDWTREKCIRFATSLRRFSNCFYWWVGDTLNQIEQRFGKTLADEAAAKIAGDEQEGHYSLSTIRVAQWVSRDIPPRERHPALSWNHHRIVRSLDRDARKYWLKQAEANGWSMRKLRNEILADEAKHQHTHRHGSVRSLTRFDDDALFLSIEESYGPFFDAFQRAKEQRDEHDRMFEFKMLQPAAVAFRDKLNKLIEQMEAVKKLPAPAGGTKRRSLRAA